MAPHRLVHLLLLLSCACISTLAAPASEDTSAAATADSPSSSSGASPSPSSPASDSFAASTAVVLDGVTPLTRFTFGSCSQQDMPQPMWPIMQAQAPQMFIWLGDVIYADRVPGGVSSLPAMKSFYRQQYAHANYTAFRRSMPTPIIGVYDDHDYGLNDGDRTYPDKEPARQMFLDFIDEPVGSPRRTRDGVYADYLFGPAGRRTKIILLDTRYNRDGSGDDMLGARQWAWLEQAIDADSEVDLFVLGSSVQLVSTDKRIGEGWRLAPKSRARLFDLFAQRRRNIEAPVVFLSGDIHMAEADVTYTCSNASSSSDSASSSVRATPFYEFTSSGLTHSVASHIGETLADLTLGSLILAPRESHAETLDASASVRGWFAGLNFGQVEVDWLERRVTVKIVDDRAAVRLRYDLPFDALAQTTYQLEEASESSSASSSGIPSLPPLIASRCAEEAARRLAPPMFVIPGVKAMLFAIILSQVGLALLIAGVWHFWSKRLERKEKSRSAREAFKLTLEEKAKARAAKKEAKKKE